MTVRIDLNADLGESFGTWVVGDDEAMLDVVTSANIACGFHAGDATTIRRTVAMAAERGVVIGAQVSYRDLAGFGRRRMDMDPHDLTADVLYQLGALEAMCRVAGTRVAYVKPHGALYTTAAVDEGQARAVVDAVAAYDRTLPLLGLPGSVLLRIAEAEGLTVVGEAFADRGYAATGHLVPRSHPEALHRDPDAVAERVVRLAVEGTVVSVEGEVVAVDARSVCTHGDTPDAVALARAVRDALEGAGMEITPFVDRRAMSTGPTILPAGPDALLLEVAGLDEVLALDAALRAAVDGGAASWASVTDVVPAARTVLLVTRPGTDLAALAAAIRALPPPGIPTLCDLGAAPPPKGASPAHRSRTKSEMVGSRSSCATTAPTSRRSRR
jgi:UPF0271 protein